MKVLYPMLSRKHPSQLPSNSYIAETTMYTNITKGEEEQEAAAPESTNIIASFVKENENISPAVCNYAVGKWVVDDNRPLYSGSGCKQWLSGMWACRLTQRTDFEYEKFRWQPKNCKMEEFSGSKFLERMRDKTLAFIGDSLGRQQFQSLMCMITGGEEDLFRVEDAGTEYGLVKARGAVRPDGWAYRFPTTNTTVLFYWSASLCDLEPLDPTNPLTEYAMHLDRPPAFLKRFIDRFQVVVLNTGHHWNRGKLKANRWVMHVNGSPIKNSRLATIEGAKNYTVYSIVNWVNSQLPKYPGMRGFYRALSPRHFFNGDWNTGGTCDSTTPMSRGLEVLKEESDDVVGAGAVKGTSVQLLDITGLSQLRDEGHMSRYSIRATPGMQDCLHWCLPGIPDTWNEILFAQL
ncbi:protein trichome birefringence-like 16 isoform X2 [Impatiens glandulifera]|uniref:protein trichome birefringence-like 16 isoform X2 n=1 Tax=Impatiens glandulifera TaxID=253017 RepID=UPI001FB1187C|nr:protein trichome birefringence-like 16 isoform X2 [Impatiens glandulifera]